MYCYNCMNEIKEGTFCTGCMTENNTECAIHHLKPGTILNKKYVVGNVLGEGGFGITYIGLDTTLDIKVAIKEFYPNGYVNRNHDATNEVTITTEKNKDFFDKGKERFLTEARNVAKFNREKGIVDVRDYFEENDTAYIIMEYLDGQNLGEYVKKNGNMDAKELFVLMLPIMESLKKIHVEGIIHRDISPDNLMYMKDGSLMLMDFGSARHFSNEENHLSVVLKVGYAPEEQYRKNGVQGPWTDVYGMCATIYRCITGVVPEDSLDRLHTDTLKKPSELGVDIKKSFEAILIYGLAVHKENRCKDMNELIELVKKALKQENVEIQHPVVSDDDIYKTRAADEDYRTQVADYLYDDKIAQNPVHNPGSNNSSNNKKYITIIIAIITIAALAIVGCLALVFAKPDNDKTQETTPQKTEEKDESAQQTEAQKVQMIKCIDDNYKDAVKELNDLGLEVETDFEFNNVYAKDQVISQSVDVGVFLNKGDAVTLVVSKGTDVCPYDYSQKVVVSAKNGSSSATLKLYNWKDGEWNEELSCGASVGKQGISSSYGESNSATPLGTFKLGTLIAPSGVVGDINNSMWPTYVANSNTCIIDDSSSYRYNQIVEKRSIPSGTGYDRIGDGLTNGECVAMLFIEHNGDGFSSDGVVAGKGSAITICGMNYLGSSTYGCIDIAASDFYALMSKLDYSKNPHIETMVK